MRAVCNIAFLAVLIGCFAPRPAPAQSAQGGLSSSDILTCSPAPCVLPPTQVSGGGFLVNTPFIVADPLNPKNLLLGANDNNCPRGSDRAYFNSGDGGSTWIGPVCASGTGLYTATSPDASVGYDRQGNSYGAGADMHEGREVGLVGVQKSTDGVNWGKTVTALRLPNSWADDTWLAVDSNASSPFVNSVYVSAVVISPPFDNSKNQVIVAHSNDGGATREQVAVAPVQHSPAVDRYTNMVVGKDGTVYLAWMYCNVGPFFCNDYRAHMVFSKSSDGGNTWSAPTLMITATLHAMPNSDTGVTDYPAIGVDNSNGPYAGSLYAVMNTWTGTYLRVGVIRSTDGGKTWSKPVPVAPPSETHDQFFPWLSVSPTGLVGVSWLDRRNDPANVKYQAFAAISRDGGQSFQPNVQLTTAFSDPNINGDPVGWMGNYTTNTWAGPNNFVAAWMDSSNGVDMQVMIGGIRLK